jgi:hypothetical protein
MIGLFSRGSAKNLRAGQNNLRGGVYLFSKSSNGFRCYFKTDVPTYTI